MSDKSDLLELSGPAKPYRTLLFFSVYGKLIAYLASGAVLVGCTAFWWLGYGVIWFAVGVGVSGLVLLLLSCFAELIDLIVDTMIPK
jgi:hypothetical protein